MKRILRESLATLLTIAGLGGIIWSFHLGPIILTVSSLALIAGAGTVLIVRYVQSRGPEFTISNLEKTLQLHDPKGHSASLERKMSATSNLDGLSEIWIRNVAADGKIENIRIDGKSPSEGDVIHQLGLTHIRIPLNEPVNRGQQISDCVSYHLLDSFLRESEALIHVVNQKTDVLRMTVIFPAARPFKRATLAESYGGSKQRPIEGLKLNDGGQKLNVEIERPKLGGSYELRWEW